MFYLTHQGRQDKCVPRLSRRSQILKLMKAKKSYDTHLQLPHSILTTFWQLSRTFHHIQKAFEVFPVISLHEIWRKSHVGEVRYVVGSCNFVNLVILLGCRHSQSVLTSQRRDTTSLGQFQHLHNMI